MSRIKLVAILELANDSALRYNVEDPDNAHESGIVGTPSLLQNHVPIGFSALWTYRGYIRHYKIDKEIGSGPGCGRILSCLLWDSPLNLYLMC